VKPAGAKLSVVAPFLVIEACTLHPVVRGSFSLERPAGTEVGGEGGGGSPLRREEEEEEEGGREEEEEEEEERKCVARRKCV
jgi:hypothetical protein